jgi:hypothetical protein
MHQFSGTKFVVVMDESRESEELAAQMRHCLIESGWIESNWVGRSVLLWEGVFIARN